jgi:hypothetical protein
MLNDLKGQFSLKEFMVDFFGALMPGVLFLFFLLLSLFTSIVFAAMILQCGEENCNEIYKIARAVKNFLVNLRSVGILSLFILFLAIGYAIGTLFYRRDPKYPDYRSFLKIASKFSAPELANWVVAVKVKTRDEIKARIKKLRWYRYPYYRFYKLSKARKHFPATIPKPPGKLPDDENFQNGFIANPKLINALTVDESDVQYPYNNLHTFLLRRGREDLASKVHWRREHDIENIDANPEAGQRSKTFINTLKIKLQFRYPEKCGTIIKNEAHIRLSSSMWFAASALIKSSLLGLLILAGAIIFSRLTYKEVLHYIYPIVFNIITLSLAYIARRNSEQFLHYQRVREIVYVMETDEQANQMDEEKNKQKH